MHHRGHNKIIAVNTKINAVGELAHDSAANFTVYGAKRQRVGRDAFYGLLDC